VQEISEPEQPSDEDDAPPPAVASAPPVLSLVGGVMIAVVWVACAALPVPENWAVGTAGFAAVVVAMRWTARMLATREWMRARRGAGARRPHPDDDVS
jgi:hypothetical protein